MKKLIKKAVLFSLLACMTLSTFACGKKPADSDKLPVTDDKPVSTVNPAQDEYVYEGTHAYNVAPSGKTLIADGKSQYTIIYPESGGELIKTGVNELIKFLLASTGVQLAAKSDKGLTYSSADKYISLGNTALVKNSGVTAGEKLGSAGFVIKSAGNSVFLLGHTDRGTLYSVYEFLLREIDFRAYYGDAYHYEKKTSVELYDFDVTDVPDYEYRLRDYGIYDNDALFAHRMRINREEDIWIPVDKDYWHNALNFVPPTKYADHPLWYSADKMQLCFNAHGNKAELELMYAEILKRAKECADAYPDRENISFTQEDGIYWCGCDACTAELNKYGTGAPGIIKICNRLAKDLNAYLNPKGRSIKVSMFAYGKSSLAPVNANADGSYTPIDDSCVCGENVNVFFAPINADYRYPVYDGKSGGWGDNAKAWATLTNQTYVWLYSTNFDDYLMPYNSFDSIQGNYKFLKGLGADYLFNQGQFNQKIGTGWSVLKMWLNSKLTWNVNLDFNALLDEFFANYFCGAGKAMREMFEMYRLHMRYIQSEYNIESGTNINLLRTEYWPKAFINQLLAKADEAYAAAEKIKIEDPETYRVVCDRICLETMSYRYIDISLYNGLKNLQEQTRCKKQFRQDAERVGISLFCETTLIDDLWAKWNI